LSLVREINQKTDLNDNYAGRFDKLNKGSVSQLDKCLVDLKEINKDLEIMGLQMHNKHQSIKPSHNILKIQNQ
jgi:hypothetical protein